MTTLAVLPALGIGDALLMMIASYQLKKKGYEVTTFHHTLPELSSWFPGQIVKSIPPHEKLADFLSPFDHIFVENDNSAKIKQLLETHRPSLSLFYPTYSPSKHAPLSIQDRVFNKDLPMADNIAEAIASSKENGLTPPANLSHRVKKERVILHPTSREIAKNWKVSGFLTVARELKNRGFDPLFCVSSKELPEWRFVEEKGFCIAGPSTLSDLASLVYESGFVIGNDSLVGHLASNLGVPTLIIAGDEKRMRLWRPGWLKGQLVLPPSYLPNWKFLRVRWQHLIAPNRVLSRFDKLTCTL